MSCEEYGTARFQHKDTTTDRIKRRGKATTVTTDDARAEERGPAAPYVSLRLDGDTRCTARGIDCLKWMQATLPLFNGRSPPANAVCEAANRR